MPHQLVADLNGLLPSLTSPARCSEWPQGLANSYCRASTLSLAQIGEDVDRGVEPNPDQPCAGLGSHKRSTRTLGGGGPLPTTVLGEDG
jgi:hypothetical protein